MPKYTLIHIKNIEYIYKYIHVKKQQPKPSTTNPHLRMTT